MLLIDAQELEEHPRCCSGDIFAQELGESAECCYCAPRSFNSEMSTIISQELRERANQIEEREQRVRYGGTCSILKGW